MGMNIEESPLYRILNPRGIAFFGASNSFSSMGTTQLTNIRELGFEGHIYAVHPKEDRVQGLPTYRSVLDLPEAPDLAVMVLPTQIVSRVMDECGRKGVRSAIVISGGFREVGAQGAALESELVKVVRGHGIRLLGPNCIGVVNAHHRLNTTFYPYRIAPGFIGMASQSGSFITQMFEHLGEFGLGFSAGISVGNEATLDLVDALQYLGACPRTKVIALYIEAIRRGREFVEAARAITPRKPIVAFYVGGSEAGKRAGFSHTGAMAGPDRLYDGMFRQAGIIRAQDIDEMFDFCWALAACPRPPGARVVVQTHSGGPGAAAADAAGRAGLHLLPLSSGTVERLKAFIPHTGSVNNPVDLTFNKNPLDYFSSIPQVILGDEGVDGMLIYILIPTHTVQNALRAMGVPEEKLSEKIEKILVQQVETVAGLVQGLQKPVIGYSYRRREDSAVRRLQDLGIPVFPSPERAAKAMAALVRYGRMQTRIKSS
jgi:acyl-CoA synthetase (NDP forming)